MLEQPYIPSISEISYDNPNTQEHLDKQIVQTIEELQELSSSMGKEYAKDVVLNKEGSDIEIIPEQPRQGDKNDYSPTARDTHINQIRTYREMLLRERGNNPQDIDMSLVYFSSKENKPEVIKIIPLI